MLRVIFFLIVACIVVAVAWLLAGVPGHVVASVGSYTVETSTPFAILMFAVAVVLILILSRALRGVVAIPRTSAGWRRRRRRALGERAITRVLVALAAGEQDIARKQSRRARHLLGESPQTLLLVAEAGRLSGQEEEAEQAFRSLAKHKEGRFLGLRGLLRQAVDRRDWSEALIIAKQAEAAHPGTAWLRQQRAELALQTGNWAEAVELIGPDARQSAFYIAAADAESDPSSALSYAKQAWIHDPTFPPATLAYAARLRATGYERRAQSCVMDAWKQAPHPDLAAFAVALEHDGLARVQAAKRLVARNPTHTESRVLLARVALEAGLTGEARHQIDAAQSDGFHQRRLYLLLAEVEERERGETEAGRLAQRDALRRAATAEPDPKWQCKTCQTSHAAWHIKCEMCDGVDTIQWVSGVRTAELPAIAG